MQTPESSDSEDIEDIMKIPLDKLQIPIPIFWYHLFQEVVRNLYTDGEPLRLKGSLKVAMDLATKQVPNLFIQKRGHEMFLELKDKSVKNTIASFSAQNLAVSIGTIIQTPGIECVANMYVVQRLIVENSDDEKYTMVRFIIFTFY